MVMPGQYLERPTLLPRPTPDGEVTLEGLYHRGPQAPALLVCAPHPRLGGSMDSPVVAELAWAVTRGGHASQRFNYQGVGASGGHIAAPLPDFTGTPHGLEVLDAEVEDARAAFRSLTESTTHGRVAVAGYSFGAAVALRLAREEPSITHLLLIAPPTVLFRFDALAEVERPVFLATAQKDPWCDRIALTAIVKGRSDVKHEVVAGADHTFTRGLTELGKVAAGWLGRRVA